MKPGPQPHMLNETPAQLVKHLENPSGWWRDSAQKLLVLRGDKSVLPALSKMALSDPEPLARIHALWTMEGLDAVDPSLIREKLKDTDPHVRIAAVRNSEDVYQSGDHSLVKEVAALAKDPDVNVVIQVCLTAERLKWPDWDKLLVATVADNKAYGVQKLIGPLAHTAPPPAPNAPPQPPPRPIFTASEKQVLDRGELIYKQLCFACHGLDGNGTPLQGTTPPTTMAPPLRNSKTATGFRDGVISVVLKGLNGPVDGKNYTALMVPMESNDDAWIAAVISYIRNNFGNRSTLIGTNDVARVRAAILNHTNTWTLEELHNITPQPIADRQAWHLTASHNPGSLPAVIDGNPGTRYESREPQSPGMWVQIELPEPTEITGVELDSTASVNDYARGYKVQLSDDGQSWGPPVATGNSTSLRNQIVFTPQVTKFIRITQTGTDPSFWWSIGELQVLKYPSATDVLQPPDLFPAADAPTVAPTPAVAPAISAVLPQPEPEPEITPYTVQ
jgi:mono/diheme cytochrome c family protein